MIGDFLDKRGYRKQPHPAGKPLREMEPGTYTLTLQKIRLFGELTQLSKPPGNATVPPGPLDWLTY